VAARSPGPRAGAGDGRLPAAPGRRPGRAGNVPAIPGENPATLAPRLPTAAILCTVGVLLDALAMVWSPELYAANPARLVGGAAWLLFGVGAILTAAMLQDRPR